MHRPELNSVERDRSSHRQFRRGRQPVVAQNTRSRPFCERGHACLNNWASIVTIRKHRRLYAKLPNIMPLQV